MDDPRLRLLNAALYQAIYEVTQSHVRKSVRQQALDWFISEPSGMDFPWEFLAVCENLGRNPDQIVLEMTEELPSDPWSDEARKKLKWWLNDRK